MAAPVLTQIQKTQRPEFDALRGLLKRRGEKITAAEAIARHMETLKAKSDAARDAFNATPTVKAFDHWVQLRTHLAMAEKCWGELGSHVLSYSRTQDTCCDEGREILAKALRAYAAEVKKTANQIDEDARVLADKSGVEHSTPAAVISLRTESEKADQAAAHCEAWASEDPSDVFHIYSPILCHV